MVPYQPFPVKDGRIIIAVGDQGQIRRLCLALVVPEVAEDLNFASNEQRVANREALDEILSERTVTRNGRD